MGPKKAVVKTIEYPPDCKEVSTELSKDELHRRLKVRDHRRAFHVLGAIWMFL